MRNRNSRLVAIVAAISILLSVAIDAAAEESPFASRIGWLKGFCLAIQSQELQPGASLAAIVFDPGERSVAGKILGKSGSAGECLGLTDYRGAGNESEGVFFYAVSLEDVQDLPELGISGIAILGIEPEELDRLDLDGNGVTERFSKCTAFEGSKYAIWNGEPYEGEPLWEGYYYRGYETEEDCPG